LRGLSPEARHRPTAGLLVEKGLGSLFEGKMAGLLEGPKVITMSQSGKDRAKIIKEARGFAAQRGHTLGEFTISRIVTGYPPTSFRGALVSRCLTCGDKVGIDPVHGAIFGDALENDCPRE